MNPIEMKQLIVKSKKHNPEAFTILMQHFSKDMFRTAYAILLNDEDAADAIQDTILACWQKMDTLQEDRFFKTWMTRVLINKCYDIRKHRESHVPIEDCEKLTADSEYGGMPASNEYQLQELQELLAHLEEPYRLPMMLFYGEELKIGEIAKLLHMPPSTVQTRLSRGRKKLALYLKGRE